MILFFELQGLERFSRNSGLWERIKRRRRLSPPTARFSFNRRKTSRSGYAASRGVMTLVKQAGGSFVDIATLRFLLFARTKQFQDSDAPRYQRGPVGQPLREIAVILPQDIRRRFLGELAMIFRKHAAYFCELL